MTDGRTQGKFRGYISGQRWSGIMEFLFEATNVGSLKLTILKDDKGIINRTIYFEVTGDNIEVSAFMDTARKAVADHNGEVVEKEPPKGSDKAIIEHELKGEKLAEQMKKMTEERMKDYPETGSEFGKGFLYCLTMFMTHFTTDIAENLQRINFLMGLNEDEREKIFTKADPKHDYGNAYDRAEFYFKKITPIHGSYEKMLSSEITLWANGASDHLYELECPEKFKGTEIEKKVDLLRDLGLQMGHGAGLMGMKEYTMDDFIYLKNLTGEIIKLVDKDLGIEVIEAQYGEF